MTEPSRSPGRESVGAVVTAGGNGLRFGGLKQFAPLAGSTVLRVSVERALQVSSAVIIPVPDGGEGLARHALEGLTGWSLVRGGATRAFSVLAGLRALPEVEWVVVHDAARPFASLSLFERVLIAAQAAGAAVPGLTCADTVKRVDQARIVETLDRGALRFAQTPQAFRRAALLEAYATLGEGARDRTDDAHVYEVLGRPIAWVEGEGTNRKLTRPEDLEPKVTSAVEGASLVRPAQPGVSPGPRIGVGYDVHPFSPGRRLILGGAIFEGDGLLGHSDADVVSHAVADALLGAASLGDLGRHFPPGDPSVAGADSLELLGIVVGRVRDKGLRVGNVDLTIVAKRPAIAPRAAEMGARLAAVLGVLPGDVNVKATTGDGLGFVGRGEGIAVHAVAVLLFLGP